jgi:hypothetical protein
MSEDVGDAIKRAQRRIISLRKRFANEYEELGRRKAAGESIKWHSEPISPPRLSRHSNRRAFLR